MAKITIRKTLAAEISNAVSSEYVSIFVDDNDNKLKYKNDKGDVFVLQLQNEDTVKVNTTAYTVSASDRNILCKNNGDLLITIPTELIEIGRNISIIDINDADANNITIETEGSASINGAPSYKITTKFASVTIISDGSDWFIKNN